MDWKSLLKASLTALLPIGYAILQGKFPDFPWSQEGFVQTVLWLIAFLVGGWQANNLVKKK